MKSRELGRSGLKASVVAFGTWGLGGGRTWSDTQTDVKKTAYLLDAAYDRGINLVDTAPVYGVGAAEELLGQALRGRRDRFLLSTKCGLNWRDGLGEFEYERDGKTVCKNLTGEAIRKDLEDSLRRMQTDHIDIYITHRQTDKTSLEETMGTLMALIQEGKIRAVGISNATPDILSAYEEIGPVALVQEKLSLLTPGAKKEYLPRCNKHKVAFQVYSSLESGALTGPSALGRVFPAGDVRGNNRFFAPAMKPALEKMYNGWAPLCEKYACSLANLAQAWTLAQYEGINLLTGFRRVESMEDTCKAVELVITPEDLARLEADVAALPAQ